MSAAVEHSRAIGSAPGPSEWRKREIARIPRATSELNGFIARNMGSYWHPVGTCETRRAAVNGRADLVKKEIARWTQIIKAAGVGG